MAVATLPAAMTAKLDDLARRLRRLRLLRGVSRVALVTVVGAGLLLGLDAGLELAPLLRIALCAAWIAAVTVAAWRFLLRPMRRPLSPAVLAAAVEERYPLLDERLSSAVELSENGDGHGSRAFVGLLIRETELKTRAVDFLRAAPPKSAARLFALAAFALVLLVAPACLWPDEYFGLGRRLLMPWDRRPAVIPFFVAVTPGDGYAARGRPLTIAVELQPARAAARLPDAVTLILTAGDGTPLRLRMPAADRPNSFAFRIDKVTSDYHYQVEAGPVESDRHSINVVDPVELAGSTTTLTAPAYATTVPPQTVNGPAELAVLQHGRAAIACRFDRPAEAATLIVTPAAGGTPQRRPLTLTDGNRSARVEWPARTDSRLQMELSAAHGITTLTPEQTLTVTPDRPPQFRRAAGLPEHGDARPTASLTLDLAVADDLAVAAVELEYRVNAGAVQHEPLTLAGLGTPTATGRSEFKLAGKVKDGDRLYVRLRATDNRNVPESHVEPNVVTFPAEDRWCELEVRADAGPIREREITARRDDIEKFVRDLIARIDQATRQTDALHESIEQNRSKPDEQARTTGELNDEQAAMSKQLAELARDADVAGLTPLAERLQAIAEQEFRRASEAFRDAAGVEGPARLSPLKQAGAALTDARLKLEAFLKENRAVAELRLDEVKLEDLANRESELAEQAKEAPTPEDQKRLADEQKRIAEELDKLTQANDELRDAIRASHAAEARKLAEEAKKLAQAERDVDAKLAAAERARNAGRLADLAHRQQELAEQAGRLAKQTQPAAKTAKAQPLNADPAGRAADDLRSGDADAALRQQDRSGRELDRLADDLQRGIETAADPREAAKQLSKLQEENRQRLRTRPAERPLARREQEAIQKAIEGLTIPDDVPAAARDRQQAAELAAEAARALNRDAGGDAEFRMGQAKESLDKLANDLPTAEKRQRRARDEVAKLRQSQEEIGRTADRTAAGKQQADVAARLGKLDAPGQETRRARAAEAAARAVDDLQAPGSADVPASQQAAIRALERLAEALAGKTPADEKARQLARQERDIETRAQKAGNDPLARRDLEKKQEQVALDTLGLNAPDAPVRQSEAGQATIRANTALRAKPGDPATRQKLDDAADALDQLADQLAGRESEAQRAERLAAKQESAARQPPSNAIDARRQAKQIAEETKQVRAGPQAAAAKREANDALARLQQAQPGTPENGQAQSAAARALRRLADEMNRQSAAKTATPDTRPAQPAPPSPGPTGVPTPDQVRQARELATKQRDLRDQVRQAAAGDHPDQADRDAADQTQSDLAKQAANLARSLDQTAGKMADDAGQQSAKGAAESARQGEQSLKQAQGNDPAQAKQARRRAAEALDRAAEQATQAAEPGKRRASPNGRPEEVPPEAGQSLQDAKGEMSQAQEKLGRGEAKPAGDSMNKAADALRNAAGQVGRRDNPRDSATRPADAATAGNSPPNTAPLPKDLQQHAGKKWGELPGELRTRIIQEMKAQYGDDYARVIKLYFEQIAETGGKK